MTYFCSCNAHESIFWSKSLNIYIIKMSKIIYTTIREQYLGLLRSHARLFNHSERKLLKQILIDYYNKKTIGDEPDHPIEKKLNVIRIVLNDIGLGKAATLCILLQDVV